MATIYTIKGTDSISSSRLNINDNFDKLNTELIEVHSFFGISAQSLTLTGPISAAAITASGNVVAQSALTVTGLTTLNGDLIVNKSVRFSVATGTITTLPNATSFDKSIYQVTCTSNISEALHNGNEGQEILIKAIGTATKTLTLLPDSSNIHGVAAGGIILTVGDDTKDTVLLRYFAAKWHIVSVGSGATVS